MSLQNIKASNRGFTIVELLIVVVVIAILAAITIISYNGITSRANASSAASNAETVQKVAEAFNSDGSRYPATQDQFRAGYTDSTVTTAAAKLPTSIKFVSPALTTATPGTGNLVSSTANFGLTASNGTTYVAVYIVGTAGTAGTSAAQLSSGTSSGGVIITWNYSGGAAQTAANYTYYGSANSSSTFTPITLSATQ